jgi:hypothetical protein
MKRPFILLLMLCIVAPVFAAKKTDPPERPFEVQRLSSTATVSAESYTYALPRTVLRIKVTVERSQFTRGIYADYAEKYLGIADVKKKNQEQYSILSIGVNPLQEADPEQIYVVNSQRAMPEPLSKMQQTGLALGLPFTYNATLPAVAMTADDWAIPPFTNMGYEVDVYKATHKASAAVAATADDTTGKEDAPLPIVSTAVPAVKSKEARAMEAAKILTQLRKRRMELVCGEIEAVFANGEALKTALYGIKEIEQQYLELFVGKMQYSEATYYYDIVPVKGKNRYPLFFFSNETGIDAAAGAEIVLNLQCTDAVPANTPNSAAYKYRVPCTSEAKITEGEDELFRGRYPIYQFGNVVNLLP